MYPLSHYVTTHAHLLVTPTHPPTHRLVYFIHTIVVSYPYHPSSCSIITPLHPAHPPPHPPLPPGDSLVARCDTCRRLLLYNEQGPGPGLEQGPGSAGPGPELVPGPGQGFEPGQEQGLVQEQGPGQEHDPGSELGSGSGSELYDGIAEVGVVAVASLDVGEGGASTVTATATVAVIR